MIIFGTKIRQQVVDEGEFFCPKCQTQRHYLRKKASRYFSLYFIPVIPIGKLGEFVECQTCGVAFEPVVLERRFVRQRQLSREDLTRMVNSLDTLLQQGRAVELLVRDLTGAGLDRDVALQLIEPHLAAGRQHCVACGLTYAAGVARCSECQGPLT